jgi:hypothetical protein
MVCLHAKGFFVKNLNILEGDDIILGENLNGLGTTWHGVLKKKLLCWFRGEKNVEKHKSHLT